MSKKLSHDEAIDAIYGVARMATLSYQEAIEGYLRLRGETLHTPKSQAEIETECAEIEAMSSEQIDALTRANGHDPETVVRHHDILVRNTITIVRMRKALENIVAEYKSHDTAGIDVMFQIASDALAEQQKT